jgi:molybdopterin-guanine dinucleotide biosynthesis protein A
MALSAAVLTGGASRRMGVDKALLDVDGQPLLARTLATLRAVAEIDDVTIVGARDSYACFGAPVVADDWPGVGTLGGLATALRVARHAETLVVACDLPWLAPALIAALAREPHESDVLLPMTCAPDAPAGLQAQPLLAIYARRCLPAFETRLRAGRLKVIDALEDVTTLRVYADWLRQFDPQLRSFINVNTPAQLDAARQLAER